MPIPDSLGPAVRIPLQSGNVRAAACHHGGAAGGAASIQPQSRSLPFAVQTQERSRWCWSAVSLSVALFYDPKTTWTQCGIAEQALSRLDCCSDTQACDQDWYLDAGLKITQNYRSIAATSYTFGQLQIEINNGRPLGCRIGWFSGGGHFVALTGWLIGASGIEYIEVDDPIYLRSKINFAQFARVYQGGGDWTHTYLTQPVPAIGGARALIAGTAPTVTHPDAIGG